MVCGCMICVFTQGKQNIGSTELLILDGRLNVMHSILTRFFIFIFLFWGGGICCPIVDIVGNLTHYAPSCVMALSDGSSKITQPHARI